MNFINNNMNKNIPQAIKAINGLISNYCRDVYGMSMHEAFPRFINCDPILDNFCNLRNRIIEENKEELKQSYKKQATENNSSFKKSSTSLKDLLKDSLFYKAPLTHIKQALVAYSSRYNNQEVLGLYFTNEESVSLLKNRETVIIKLKNPKNEIYYVIGILSITFMNKTHFELSLDSVQTYTHTIVPSQWIENPKPKSKLIFWRVLSETVRWQNLISWNLSETQTEHEFISLLLEKCEALRQFRNHRITHIHSAHIVNKESARGLGLHSFMCESMSGKKSVTILPGNMIYANIITDAGMCKVKLTAKNKVIHLYNEEDIPDEVAENITIEHIG